MWAVCACLGTVRELTRPLRRAPELSGPHDKIEAFACPHLRKSVICLICCVGLACPTPVVRLAPPVPPLWGTGVPWNPSKSFMGTRECVWTLSHDKIKARTVQGRVPGFDSFHPKPAGAHTSSPLFVSLQEDKAMIMEQGVACLDF